MDVVMSMNHQNPQNPQNLILSPSSASHQDQNRRSSVVTSMPLISLTINGRALQADVDPETPLLWVLRDHLNLVGTKFGCGGGFCGACTVHVDGAATRSCQLPVTKAAGRRITTVEGLSATTAHPVQRAWAEIDVPQC